MNSIILRAHEVQRLQATGSVLVVRPVKPQPHKDIDCFFVLDFLEVPRFKPGWNASSRVDCRPYNKCLICPLGAPGDVLKVRETYAVAPPGVMARGHKGGPIYAADFPPFTETGFGPWTSGATMPPIYSRLTVTVATVDVGRANKLDNWGLLLTGFPPDDAPDTGYPMHDFYMRYEVPFLKDFERRHKLPADAWVWKCEVKK